MRIWATLLLGASLCMGAVKTELGEINGAKFRIDVPENWNGGLVMYCHGYSPVPGNFDNPRPNPVLDAFTAKGYAVAQSGYAAGGWAIQEAVVDTESLRRYFVKKYGQPQETWVTGHSMGGFLTMVLMETHASVYDGGLALCGPLAPPNYFMARGAFDGRVLFDYYFPGMLSSPANVNEDPRTQREVEKKILAALEAEPGKAEILRRRDGFKSNKDMAGVLTFITFLLRELQARSGGNPFDNHNVIYSGVPDEVAVNAGVKRYSADPKALAYVRSYYTPTGKLTKPMLAIHTTYDPLVPVWIPNYYQSVAEQAGAGSLFVQQYVRRDGHCTISPAETAQGFDALRAWAKSGVRPGAGDTTVPAAASGQ